MLVALAVLVGGGYLAYSYGLSALKDRLSGPEDYTGAGTGQVVERWPSSSRARPMTGPEPTPSCSAC